MARERELQPMMIICIYRPVVFASDIRHRSPLATHYHPTLPTLPTLSDTVCPSPSATNHPLPAARCRLLGALPQ